MAIFSLKENKITEENTVFENLPEMEPTTEALNDVVMEFAQDVYKLQAGLYISDVLIEEQVMFNNADAEALCESTIKEMAGKVGKVLDDLWKKIQAWFKAVLESIKQRAISGEKFVKEYKDRIKEQATKFGNEYKYEGYPYNKDYAIKTPDLCKQLSADVSKNLLDAFSSGKEFEYGGDLNDILEDRIFTKINSKVMNVSDLKKFIVVNFRGAESKGEYGINDGFSVEAKLSIISSTKDDIKQLKEYKDSMGKMLADYKQAIKKLSGGAKNIEGSGNMISRSLSLVKASVNISKSELSVLMGLYQERYSSFLRALRGLLAYKPKAAKESFWGIEEEENDSILEAAMKLI